tara:strand:- start:442 stop:1236 length:795 start_codon:yes stop_codon:yes gene_type:complete
MINKQDLVSIIMPAYNCEHQLGWAIESVISQTYKNWELIIVNDASKDKTLSVIEKYQKLENRIRLISNASNYGAAESRNIATKNAAGKYIAFLDADDLWIKDKLMKQIIFMKKNKYDFTYTYYENYGSDNKNLKFIQKAPFKINRLKMSFMCPIGCLTVVYNSDRLSKIYAPNINRRNDYVLWLKVLEKSKSGYCLKENLAKYRLSKTGLSSNKFLNIIYYFKVIRLSFKYWLFIIPITTPIYLFIILIKKKMPLLYNQIIRLL